MFFFFWRYFHYVWKVPLTVLTSGQLMPIYTKTWNEYVFSFCTLGYFIKKVIGPRNWGCHAESIQVGNFCANWTCQSPVQTGLWRELILLTVVGLCFFWFLDRDCQHWLNSKDDFVSHCCFILRLRNPFPYQVWEGPLLCLKGIFQWTRSVLS